MSHESNMNKHVLSWTIAHLIQEQDARFKEYGSRDGDALALPPRQAHALLAHRGLVGLGEGADEVVRVGDARCLFHLYKF